MKALLSLLSMGCTAEEDLTSSVWADDGQGIASSREVVGCPRPLVPIARRVPCEVTEVELEVAEGSLSRQMNTEEPSSAVPPFVDAFFWMRTRGYVLVQAGERVILYEDQTGAERQILELPQLRAAVPSPDGEVLALLTGGYGDGTGAIEMMRASDGQTLAWVELPGQVGAHTWTPSGRFFVQLEAQADRALAVSVEGTTEEVDAPACWYPPTTSSPFNAEGEPVPGYSGGQEPAAFGCQE